MRKGLRKLDLSRETLRALESHTLDIVQGGAQGGNPFKTQTCQTNCDCTFSCATLCVCTM